MTATLLDANVLIALTVVEHVHHDVAGSWLSRADDFAVCPIVEGALARFLLRMGESADAVMAVLEGVHRHPGCRFWPDSVSLYDVGLAGIHGYREVTDRYLVGLSADNGGRLATFDRGLATHYPDDVLLLGS